LKLHIDTSYTKITFEENEGYLQKQVNGILSDELSVLPENYIYSYEYKRGGDPSISFYNQDTQQFPTGLNQRVTEILSSHGLVFDSFDARPNLFVDADKLADTLTVNAGDITLRPYQRRAVYSALALGYGIINYGVGSGKTVVAASIIQQLLPKLQKGERIVFFVGSTEIFNQAIDRLSEHLGIDIGYYGSGKKKMAKVMVVMLPSVQAALKVDPEEGIKLSGKKADIKKIAIKYAPNFVDNPNAYRAFSSFIKFFKPTTKVEERIKEKFEDEIATCGSDKDVSNLFKGYQQQWNAIVSEKAGDKVKKKKFIMDFLDSIIAYIADECLVPDTLINMSDGSSKRVEDIKVGDDVAMGGKVKSLKKVTEKTITLRHKYGSITGSYTHPVLVKSDDKLSFKPLMAIKEGDKVIVPQEESLLEPGKDYFESKVVTNNYYVGFNYNQKKVSKYNLGSFESQLGFYLGFLGMNGIVKEKGLVASDHYEDVIKGLITFLNTIGINAEYSIEDFEHTVTIPMDSLGIMNNLLPEALKFEDDNHTFGTKERDITQDLESTVTAITYGEQEETLYDFETETHLFVADGIINHNCHHSRSDTWYNALLRCSNAIYHIGLSGTVNTKDDVLWMRLQALYGDIIVKQATKELSDNGILAKPDIFIMPQTKKIELPPEAYVDFKGHKQAKPRWDQIYRYGIVENEHRNNCIDFITKRAYDSGKTTLIIVKYAEHGEMLSEQLATLGVENVFLNGSQDMEYRKEMTEKIRNGEVKAVIATSIFDEGVDISGLDVLVLAAGGKSFREVVQRIGRVLRKKDYGGNRAMIFDFDDQGNEYLKKHTKERLSIYSEQEFPVTVLKELDL